jgi:UDP-GlcNAc:undecaprenyl-phosphate GlcNAc-1-phosphate transferase
LKKKIFLNNFSFLFTVFCILLFTNALNFYDGINGQSLIFSIIVFSFLFLISNFNFFYLFIIFILLFLMVLNLNNKLFMGDSGIYALSSAVSFFLIYEYNFTENIIFSDTIFFLLFIPCMDLFRLVIERIITGKNAFVGDRNHIHHLLMNKLNLVSTNIVLIVLSIFPILLFKFFNIKFFVTLVLSITLYFIIIIVTKKIRKNA